MSDSNNPPASATKDPRPVTPVGGTASAYSRGSNFVANVDTIDKYNEMDLKVSVTLPLRDFLIRLGVREQDLDAKNVIVNAAASSDDVLESRDKYCKSVTGETLRYGPFCELTNRINSKFKIPSILFARNDPHLIEGLCGSKRKPDVVAVSSAHPDVANDKWKTYNASGPRQSGGVSVSWQWKDIRIAVEFKMRQKVIKIGQSSVNDHPSEYTSPPRDGGGSSDVGAAPEVHKSHSSHSPSMPVSHGSGARRGIPAPKRKASEISDANSQKRFRLGEVRSDLLLCGGKYAIDQVSAVPNRRHVLEFLIIDDRLTLAYYDRAGPVYSKEFSFIDDLYTYALLLKRLSEMDSSEIGFLEELKDDVNLIAKARARLPTAGIERTTDFLFTLSVHEHELCLSSEIGRRRPYGLISRGTAVFLGHRVPDGRVFAVKISWPAARRPSEADILNEGRAQLLKLDADTNHTNKYGGRSLAEALPMVKSTKDIDNLTKVESFRWRTETSDNLKTFNETGNRICRVIVMERLYPIFELTNLDHFKQAIRDIVLAHHFLFVSKARILHRDISLHNLMIRKSDGDAVHGVLIDFDLASVGVPSSEGHHGRRTGTRRFMAIDLLEKETPPHLERFDWESLFYVICWIGTYYSNGTEIQTTALETWDADDDETLSLVKHSVLAGLKPNLGILFTDFYKPLFSLWIQDMQSMFRAANLEKTKFELAKAANPYPEEDTLVFHETLGNHVTWDKFWQILEK